MSKLLLVVVLVVLSIFFGWFFFFRLPDQAKVTKEGPIIFLGNSITLGEGAQKGDDFPSLIASELGLTNVINAGVSGDTTNGVLKRLKRDVLDKNPSIVVIEIGGNDFLARKPTSETLQNLDNIVKQIYETKAAIILVHIKFPKDAGNYESGYKKISKKYRTSVVWNSLDGIVNNPSLMADALHPNSAGHKKLAEKIITHIQIILN